MPECFYRASMFLVSSFHIQRPILVPALLAIEFINTPRILRHRLCKCHNRCIRDIRRINPALLHLVLCLNLHLPLCPFQNPILRRSQLPDQIKLRIIPKFSPTLLKPCPHISPKLIPQPLIHLRVLRRCLGYINRNNRIPKLLKAVINTASYADYVHKNHHRLMLIRKGRNIPCNLHRAFTFQDMIRQKLVPLADRNTSVVRTEPGYVAPEPLGHILLRRYLPLKRSHCQIERYKGIPVPKRKLPLHPHTEHVAVLAELPARTATCSV